MSSRVPARLRVFIVFSAVLLSICIWEYGLPGMTRLRYHATHRPPPPPPAVPAEDAQNDNGSQHEASSGTLPETEGAVATTTPAPPASPDLPAIYKHHEQDSTFCTDRFGIPFLKHLNQSATAYCTDESQASATCFEVRTEGSRVDRLCLAGPVSFNEESTRFSLPCAEESGKSFGSLGSYWYDTGPSAVFRQGVELVGSHQAEPLNASDSVSSSSTSTSTSTTSTTPDLILLMKREGASNLWHSLMEIFSATMALDAISMARDPRTGTPLLPSEGDWSRLRIVILDSHEEGPFWDAWTRFSRLPLVRLPDLKSDMVVAGSQLVIPLAGGANPFWQGDWSVLSCHESALLDTFVQRVFEWHDLPAFDDSSSSSQQPPNQQAKAGTAGPVRLTYIDRRGQRKLFDQEAHLTALRTRLAPAPVEIHVVDFAALSFAEQVRTARDTDVLVGVHGAGLTHAMFMRPESAVVEIMPAQLNHKGFRNLAKLRRLHYYGTHGEEVTAGEDWHSADVDLNLDRYLHLIDAAVAGVANSGTRNDDISW